MEKVRYVILSLPCQHWHIFAQPDPKTSQSETCERFLVKVLTLARRLLLLPVLHFGVL